MNINIMPRITVIQRGRSLVNVQLDGRTLALPNNSRRDATCTVEDGIITGPADLLEKIQDGTISVVDWHGHRVEGMEVEGAEKPEVEEAPPVKVTPQPAAEAKPAAKEAIKAKPPVKVTNPTNTGNLLEQPKEVQE